jgi:3-hydroxyisobutyrate dehydrogenase
MAFNCRTKGKFDMVVHDLRREASLRVVEAGAVWADDIATLARECDVVLTSLPGPKEAQAVGAVLEKNLRAGCPWFDLSTNSPTVVRKLYADLKKNGIPMLDSPVSGGPAGAKSGKLALIVGGDRPVFDKFKHVLDSIGDQVFYVGDIGAGSVAKLVHNMAGYAMQAAIAEVFTMGVKGGVDPLALFDIIRQCSLGRQRSFDRLSKQFLPNKYDPPDFALKLAHKDCMLATELAREIGVPMRICNLALAEMTEALNRGWGDLDSRVPMVLQQERSGVKIQVPAADIEAVFKRDG